jgi:hypothetical protein
VRGILVLEGADASGKTTLAAYLREKYGARYLHLGPYRDVWRWHLGALWRAIKLAETELVVIDRHWPSECAYGEVYRGGAQYPSASRCLDRVLRKHAALYVLCVPSNLPGQLARHRRLREKRSEYAQDVRAVVQRYSDLWHGNVAQSGVDYLSQLIRTGEFSVRDDVTRYDLDREGDRLNRVAERLLERLDLHRAHQHAPALEAYRWNLTGHLHTATHVIVGEAVSPTAYPGPRWPFTSREGPASAAGYLNLILHELNVDETRLMFTNALEEDDHLSELIKKDLGLEFVCLGRVAEKTVKNLGAPNWVALPHPQWVRRFRHHENDYPRQLREALT